MGYTTTFEGCFNLDKPLKPEHATYLAKFAETRRMQRDPVVTLGRPDPIREAAGLPLGDEAGYFVGAGGFAGQEDGFGDNARRAVGIVDYNGPPKGQPGLWCQWVPTEDSSGIKWDGGEKFYDYVEWLRYLIEHFLKPWGYVLNGEVRWAGEEPEDLGQITVKGNKVTAKRAKISYEEEA